MTKRKLTAAEVGYVLCGLRMLQNYLDTAHPLEEVERNGAALEEIIVNEGHDVPDIDELDQLCEAINRGEVEL